MFSDGSVSTASVSVLGRGSAGAHRVDSRVGAGKSSAAPAAIVAVGLSGRTAQGPDGLGAAADRHDPR
ncbi:hypothetical protein QM588_25635, partial [Rhodococcus sp. IEGM 1354]|uniref:hypothetical protein n=1 Tax=Rhodococcus sp. IEGM 1354 TaxID=3047088 RepID=UPI0024B7B880